MLTIDKKVYQAYPDAKMGLLIMKNIHTASPLEQSVILERADAIHRRYGHLNRAALKALHPIQAYIEYYKNFGYSYHVLAQLESVMKGRKGLQAESGLLQAMLLTELESMLLIAGHDYVTFQLPLQLKIAAGDETYSSISGKEVTTVKNDIMVCDGNSVISSIMRGPDSGSRITQSTTQVVFTIYAPPGIDTDYITQNLRKLEERIISFSPAAEIALLHVYEKRKNT